MSADGSDFSQGAELSLTVPNRELSAARSQIEDALSDIPVGIDASSVGGGGRGPQPRDPSSGRFRSRRGAEQRLLEQIELDEERNQLLDDIKDAVEGRGIGGGGGGGMLLARLGLGAGAVGAGLFGGAAAFSLGGAARRLSDEDAINLGAGATGAGRAPVDPTNRPDWFDILPDWFDNTPEWWDESLPFGQEARRRFRENDPTLSDTRPPGPPAGAQGRNAFRRSDPALTLPGTGGMGASGLDPTDFPGIQTGAEFRDAEGGAGASGDIPPSQINIDNRTDVTVEVDDRDAREAVDETRKHVDDQLQEFERRMIRELDI